MLTEQYLNLNTLQMCIDFVAFSNVFFIFFLRIFLQINKKAHREENHNEIVFKYNYLDLEKGECD